MCGECCNLSSLVFLPRLFQGFRGFFFLISRFVLCLLIIVYVVLGLGQLTDNVCLLFDLLFFKKKIEVEMKIKVVFKNINIYVSSEGIQNMKRQSSGFLLPASVRTWVLFYFFRLMVPISCL